MKIKYSYIFADSRHKKIRTMQDLKAGGYHECKFGFYLNGKPIGEGALCIFESKNVHTEWVHIDKKYRKKGHGIHLYRLLISCARKIGAERVYSSRNLNKLSRRMWSEKLPKLFNVRESKHSNRCRRCHVRSAAKRYYIILHKNSA